MTDGLFALKARFVVPVESPPLENATITVDAGRISAVGENRSGKPPRDLGNAAILPGLINAHTHLEFSHLGNPLGEPGMCFPDWIRAVVASRQETSLHAIQRGVNECLRAGVTTVADIIRPHSICDTTGSPPYNFRASPIRYFAFRELIGLAEHQTQPLVQSAEHWLGQVASESNWQPALSPHAPYTVHPELLRSVARLSALHHVPLAMHLAESREELDFLASHSGPFLDLLVDLNAWEETAIPALTRPLDYLRTLANAERALVIHGNYLNVEEIRFLATHSDRMSVIYCPRTHAFFKHDHYPLAAMLAAGVNVAVGTDSRASNPDLNLLDELRFIVRHHRDVAGETVMRLGTTNAAAALGLSAEIGSLSPGKRADLACVALPDRASHADVYEQLFDSSEPVIATFVGLPDASVSVGMARRNKSDTWGRF